MQQKQACNIIFLETDLSIGDIVSPKVDADMLYSVIGFQILGTADKGEAKHFIILCGNGTGNMVNFYPHELEKVNTRSYNE
jgi:hypothetical protein